MSRHSFLRSASWMLMAPVLLCSSGCWGVDQGPRDEEVCGFLGTFVGIQNAYVDVYPLDEITGRLLRAYPVASTLEPTDENGEFCMTGKDSDITGMLLFVARGGEVREYWSDTPAELGVEHLTAVVEHWTKGRPLSITPWTTLSYKLAKGRYRNGEEETFYGAVLTAEELVYEHFIGNRIDAASRNHCSSMLNCLKPALILGDSDSDVSPDKENYTLTLLSLSALAAEWSGPSASTKGISSVKLTTEYLAVDAIDGRFDGFETNQPLETTVNTLRSEIVRAYAVNGPIDTPYLYADYRPMFERIASNTNPRLFGEGHPEIIDVVAPTVYATYSPIFDERDSRITFDDNRLPTHDHASSSIIALESVFEAGCSEIHKHVNLLNDTDIKANPLRWRFSILDDITGLAKIHTEVKTDTSVRYISNKHIAIEEESFPGNRYKVTVTVTADDVPELLTQEGEFKIKIVATDVAGNESLPLEGCWKHVPRAAPLWVGQLTSTEGPESIMDYSLERDNLSLLLNGLTSSLGAPSLASFEVYNPNKQSIYLDISTYDILGEFAWTWDYDYIPEQHEEGLDSCIQLGTCTPDAPRPGLRVTPSPNPSIPTDGLSFTATNALCGEDCSSTLMRIEPGTLTKIYIRWSEFGIMLPKDIKPGNLAEFEDPADGQGLATGIGRIYIHCIADNGDGTCTERRFYEELITMRAARLDVHGVIIGKTSASPSLPLRVPIGQESSFGTGREFSQHWVTIEN